MIQQNTSAQRCTNSKIIYNYNHFILCVNSLVLEKRIERQYKNWIFWNVKYWNQNFFYFDHWELRVQDVPQSASLQPVKGKLLRFSLLLLLLNLGFKFWPGLSWLKGIFEESDNIKLGSLWKCSSLPASNLWSPLFVNYGCRKGYF